MEAVQRVVEAAMQRSGARGVVRAAPVERLDRGVRAEATPQACDGAVVAPALMGAFLLRRLWQSAILLVAVTVLVFVIVLAAGDPVRVLLPIDAAPSDVENLRHQLGLDQPIWVQYLLFVQHAATGDLGQSFKFHEPAMPLVLERLPLTAILAITSLAWASLVALPLGILAATRRGSLWDHVATAVSVLTVSVPAFWLGIVLILYFAGQLRWLPASGAAGPSSLLLPALTLGAQPLGLLTRLVRAAMLEELRRGYWSPPAPRAWPNGWCCTGTRCAMRSSPSSRCSV
jgi:ABC-type dipeptide/oligopeptide/nickel transport system permease component